MSRLVLLVTFACALSARAENLLANPGFDEVDGRGLPKRWDLYVMSKPGASGRLDTGANGGGLAATLRIPEPYANDPANNWSQSIMADLGEKELFLSGVVKTEDATEAAIWLQCWRRNPSEVVASASTSTKNPVYGTRDWTRVDLRLTAPPETDFVMVRCVLKGQGVAWFDDLSLTDEPPHEEDAELAELDVPEPPARAAEPPNELLQTNQALRDALEAVRKTNDALLGQIRSLQDEIATLRSDIARPVAPTQPTEPTRPTVTEPGHPLVPRTAPAETQKPKSSAP